MSQKIIYQDSGDINWQYKIKTPFFASESNIKIGESSDLWLSGIERAVTNRFSTNLTYLEMNKNWVIKM